jgi:hypothetical protein
MGNPAGTLPVGVLLLRIPAQALLSPPRMLAALPSPWIRPKALETNGR